MLTISRLTKRYPGSNSLVTPFFAASVIVLAVLLRLSAMQHLWLIALPASVVAFSAVLDVAVNLRFHSFDWTKEEAVVKQSLSAMLGGFAPPLLCLLLGGIAFVTPARFVGAARCVMCALLWGGAAWLYRRNNAKKFEE